MTKEQIEALEGLIEDLRLNMHNDYNDFTSKFVTKDSFETWCGKWYTDTLKNIQILEDMLLTQD